MTTPDPTGTQAPPALPSRFRFESEIGRGGMAVVYRAHDRHLDRAVAIKFLSGDVSAAVGPERFQREISLMAQLVHPGIVALFDSGEVDGRLYYVMPFVPGDTLRARLQRLGRFDAEEAATIGADVAEALAYAHGFGVVHRDVKPENIFCVGGRALLADFAIARIVGRGGDGESAPTTIGMVLGTLSYMSPEWTKVMDWVARAFDRRPGRLRRMLTHHLFDRRGLAVDPRYARLLRVAGLESLL